MDGISVGGQAVIEGVMIRGPSKYAVAVRKKDRTILSKGGSILRKKPQVYKWPFIRGFVNLDEMLKI